MDMSTEGNTNGFRSSQSDFVFHSEDANDSFPRTTSNVTEIIELDSSVSDEREMQNGSTTDFRNFGINSNHAQRGLKTYESRQNKNRSGCTLQVSIQIGGASSRKNSNARKSTDESGSNLVDNQVQCANLHCQSGADLCEAPVFVLTYFGVNRMKNVLQKVCKECFDIALKHQEKLCRLLKNNEPLFSADFPNYKDDVVVMDSVAEIYEEDVLPKSVISLVEDELMGLLKKTVDRFNIDFQINTAQEVLFERYENIFASNRKINADLDAIEHCLDATRNLIYKNFKPKYKSLPPLNIVEPGELNLPLPKKKNTPAKKTTLLITPSLTPPIEDTQTTSPPSPPSTSNLESNDIVALKEVEVQAKIPPIGTLFYPLLYVGCPVYAMKTGNLGVWGKARVIEIISRTADGPNTYRVKFEYSRGLSNKIVTGKQLAFSKPSTIRYPVGTRVIALFHNSDCPAKEAYYAGVIAEPPKILNIFRYLVFFDDGYAQYVPHEKILLVCESSRFVYEDIHPDSREFIRSYLERYPERPMVKLQKGQVIKTEWNGKWWVSRVVAIDGSLAKMHFDADNRTEWIYRGSSRLGPLYSELVAAAARKEQGSLSRHRSLGIASLKKKNMPYVEYSVDQDDAKLPQQAGGSNSKNVAKKSTTPKAFNFENVSDKPQGPPNLNEIMEYTSLGFVRITSLPNRLRGRPFIPHQCGPSCIDWTKFCKEDCKGFNPLTIPLFYGFERQIVKSKTKKDIMYRTPCGMRVRNMLEMHRYLRMTESVMGLDYFDFDLSVNVLHEFHLEPHMYCTFVKDISYGRESTPVSCVNEINHSWPSFMDYSTSRIPQEGVNICLDEEFLVCCSCTDDCQDKTKCECWQLTIEGAKFNCDEDIDVSTIGYQFKRLHEPVATGIFECNQRCKCASTCFNRVAQHPLQLNLQVFRTLKKGWGLRTINDIPKGGFICIYAGRLHTEQSANNDGRMYGDEYLAELDYIEVVERYKEGYESDVIEPGDGKKSGEGGEGDGDEGGDEPDEIDESQLNSDDRDYVPEGLKRLPKVVSIVNTRGRNKKLTTEEKSESEGEKDKEEEGDNDRESMATDDDDEVDMKKKPSKFTVAVPVEEERLKKYKSVREMFGDGTDECYVMDAKSTGNIGRYLNHSCQPNVFVQNVFVDTHDLRFPWVAFFALSHIKAGTELTWDYNYDVGSVPGKVLYCYCNSAECRGRLL